MKLAYSAMIGAALFCLAISCNKKNDPPVKSVEELVKGKAWSGDLKYETHWTEQPFYVQFNSNNNQFTWTEAAGPYAGTYVIDEAKRLLTLTFTSGSTVTLTIGKNEKVSGISYGGTYSWSLQNVEFNSSGEDVIENTDWKGIETPQFGSPDNNCSMSIKPGAGLSFNSSLGNKYFRSGSVIKFSISVGPILFNYFMVVNKNKIKGVRIISISNIPSTKFELTKQ